MGWCSIDTAGGVRLRVFFFALLPLVPAVLSGGCGAQEPPSAEPAEETLPVELIRHENGEGRTVDLSAACGDRIPALVEELLAGASPVRLLVDEARIQEVKDGRALEVVFDESQRFSTAARLDTRARRLLLPLDDPYWVGTDDRPFAVVFLGEEEYGTGPYRNEEGLSLLRELESCARRS